MAPRLKQTRVRKPPPKGDLYVRVGRLVREARETKGLSQSELGAPFFTRAMVSAVELGKISPALKTLAHFATKLEVPMKDLIPD
jgi:ribosome-binding protein aMBF1 (putative translation factor)